MGNGESKAASEESNSRSDSRPPQTSSTADRQISMEELALHNKKSDCWMLIGGVVYDVSKFLSAHPGGSKPLEENAGGDATKVFKDIGACSASACSPPLIRVRLSLTPVDVQDIPRIPSTTPSEAASS